MKKETLIILAVIGFLIYRARQKATPSSVPWYANILNFTA